MLVCGLHMCTYSCMWTFVQTWKSEVSIRYLSRSFSILLLLLILLVVFFVLFVYLFVYSDKVFPISLAVLELSIE